MSEKFWENKPKAESGKLDDKEATRVAEIEKIHTLVFTVETILNTSLADLITLAGVMDVDPRITEGNFPRSERPLSSKMQIVGSVRDSFVEETIEDLQKDGQRPATVYDLLEFIPQCPELVSRLYALGSLLDEDNEKLCVKIEKKEGRVSLSLGQLGNETYRDGITHYYTPWPSSLLTVKNTPKK